MAERVNHAAVVTVAMTHAQWATCLRGRLHARSGVDLHGPDAGVFEEERFGENLERVTALIEEALQKKAD